PELSRLHVIAGQTHATTQRPRLSNGCARLGISRWSADLLIAPKIMIAVVGWYIPNGTTGSRLASPSSH
ncbi:MAG: hypothetical protein ACK52S_11360, partial [Pirellula sp.]